MNPPTRCPVCHEKLLCNLRAVEDDVVLAEELECPERHYVYQSTFGKIREITVW